MVLLKVLNLFYSSLVGWWQQLVRLLIMLSERRDEDEEGNDFLLSLRVTKGCEYTLRVYRGVATTNDRFAGATVQTE